MSEEARRHRSGVVALLGRPNAGKSTLLNALLGEKLAIVTSRPQTTRSRILGICSREDSQILFLDTPGLHESAKAFNIQLNQTAAEAADDCDVAVLLVDPYHGWDASHDAVMAQLLRRGAPVVVLGTKDDHRAAVDLAWPPPGAAEAKALLRVSARTGAGIPELHATLVGLLPEGPRYYGADDLTDRPLRFLAAELIREVAFEELAQELPYSLAVEIEDFDESRADGVRIRARILVERESQKPMVIGRGGAMVRQIGSEARRRIGRMLQETVHLALRVKVEPAWSKKQRRLQSLGYH